MLERGRHRLDIGDLALSRRAQDKFPTSDDVKMHRGSLSKIAGRYTRYQGGLNEKCKFPWRRRPDVI